MQSTRQIRRQIQSIKNTSQITKAMQMVAASKMRKSQETALMARPYAQAALNLLENVSGGVDPKQNCLLERREVKNVCILVVSSDKGLCGGLNSNIIRETLKIMKRCEDKNVSLITVGKKSENYFKRTKKISASFTGFGDTIQLKETIPLSKVLLDDFTNKKYDKIIAIYTNFISTLKQEAKVKVLLPVTKESLEETIEEIEDMAIKNNGAKNNGNGTEYKFEPSADEVLCRLLPSLIEMQVYHVVLESNASEHSARMVAMKSATDNALEILGDLKLSYNYIRQQKITQEISEILAGVAAQEG